MRRVGTAEIRGDVHYQPVSGDFASGAPAPFGSTDVVTTNLKPRTPMLPLTSIPTEVIRKSLVPYQGFILPFEIDLAPKDRGSLRLTEEQICRLDPPKMAELAINPDPIFRIFVDLFGYDLQALRAGGGESGVPEHDWNTFGRPERLPLVIRWRAFGGEAILCFGGINSHQYYVVAVADKAITPHLMKVLRALEATPYAKAQVPTEELSQGKVALKTRVAQGSAPFEPKYLSATVYVEFEHLEADAAKLTEQLEDLRFSANWRKCRPKAGEPAVVQLSWHRRLNGHDHLPWRSDLMPDFFADFQADDIIPRGLIDHVRKASVADAEAMMQDILKREFVTKEELTQRFLIEEGLSWRKTVLDPELAERQTTLWMIQEYSFRQMAEAFSGADLDPKPRAYFSRDFRSTAPAQLVDTAPAQIFRDGEVTESSDILMSVVRRIYMQAEDLITAGEYKERAIVNGWVVMTASADSHYGKGNFSRVRKFDLDPPYFAVHRGLPVRVNQTMIGWRDGMTEALACDFHLDLPGRTILYAALRRVPVPKEWKEEAA